MAEHRPAVQGVSDTSGQSGSAVVAPVGFGSLEDHGNTTSGEHEDQSLVQFIDIAQSVGQEPVAVMAVQEGDHPVFLATVVVIQFQLFSHRVGIGKLPFPGKGVDDTVVEWKVQHSPFRIITVIGLADVFAHVGGIGIEVFTKGFVAG